MYSYFNIKKKYELLKLEAAKKPTSKSIELQDFIYDLTSGSALVEIKRVDPNSVYLRSVRDV
jgi:hypothetical protein